MSQVDTDPNLQLLETLKNELHQCQTECNQTQLFLTEICNRLHSTQELIGQYHISAKIQSDRITQLEQELELKFNQLEAVNFEREELRKRIKSEKHNASQYKAALDRCLDTAQLEGEEAKQIYSQAHILASSNSESSIQITASTPFQHELAHIETQTDIPPTSATTQNLTSSNPNTNLANVKQGISQAIDRQLSNLKSYKAELRKVEVPIAAPISKDAVEERPKSSATSKIHLPQFAPLKLR
jgi:chromosome segregation ATPase